LHSAGIRTVSAVAVIQGEPNYSVTAKITIIGKPCTVTYDGNGSAGGTVPTDGNTYQQGASVTVKANTGNLVKTGYTFAGWNTAADGSGASYAGGETFTMGVSNAILYAKWTQNPTYTVTYNGNGNTGGTVPTDANAYEQGANVTVIANTGSLVKTSFTFAGWNTAADGSGTSYAGGETFNIGAANVTLYAKWTQNPTYSVTYNGNGNTGGTVPADSNAYEQGASVTVKANTGNLTKTGFTFAGWNTAADGSGTSHAGGETFNIGNANVTLYANWTQNPTYTVTYNGSGSTSGGVPTDANAYEQGASVTVKANTGNLAKTGFTFTGWNTAADGTGTSYAAAATFTMGAANVTLYAKWTQSPTYAVTYNGNGSTSGSAPADVNAYLQGATVTVLGNTGNLAKTGFTFAGWNTAADGSGTSYAVAATFAMGSANVTLYAKWTQSPTYTVTYSGNGNTTGTAPIDPNAYLQGATVTVAANTGSLAKTGVTFAGWNTAADGSGTSYAAAATFAMGTANITLYAKWTVSILTVKFNSNGGSAVDSQNVTYNNTAAAPTPPTQNGFIFAGWYSDQALTIQFNFLTPVTSSITLYAKWTPVYTVTYNGNGNTSGTVPSDANKYANGTIVTVLNNTGLLAKTGYTFAGWNTNAAGTGTDRTPGGTFSMGSVNDTLYAKWTINQITVSFNSEGGTAVAAQTVNYGSTATLPAAPAKTAYVFAGWYADSLFTNSFSFSTPTTAAVTLYARWIIQDADGNVYTETTINGKVWMVQNLRTTRYNDGTMIPQVTDSGTWGAYSNPAFCWYKNDTAYKNSYGALYNWYAANSGKVAPTGWRVAADSEWMAMFSYYGGQVQATSDALREQGTAHWPAPNAGATNSSGFTAIPTAARDYRGGFLTDTATGGVWWTSTAYNGGEGLMYDVGETWCEQFYAPYDEGYTVRCIRGY
jgi:uncharacterized protein (TIGR02145 family)/uncharacterized repeat protein (TIGR02543 family)